MTALEIVRIPTGSFFTEYERSGKLVKKEWFAVKWRELGPAASMADAKQRYGGSPVLEDAKEAV
jgi:hypothetical protein